MPSPIIVYPLSFAPLVLVRRVRDGRTTARFGCDRREQAASGAPAVADGVLPAQRGALGVYRATIAPLDRRRAWVGRGCGGCGSGVPACHVIGDPFLPWKESRGRGRNEDSSSTRSAKGGGGGVRRDWRTGHAGLVTNANKL